MLNSHYLFQCSGKREAEKSDKGPLHALSNEALALSDEALAFLNTVLFNPLFTAAFFFHRLTE